MKKLVILLAFWTPSLLLAQHTYQHLEHQNYSLLGKAIAEKAPHLHTGMKPFLRASLQEKFDVDSLLYPKKTDWLVPSGFQSSWFWRKLRNEDFVDFKRDNFVLRVNPLLQLEKGSDRSSGSSHLINTRGIFLEGTVGDKFGFYTAFYENQATYPAYLDTFIREVGMIPGQGTPKPIDETGHDFSRAEGYISFSPTEWATVQLGHGRQFVGEGYRSLLWSDNVLVYPFLRIDVRYKKWQMVVQRSQLSDFGLPTQTDKVWHYDYHYRRYAAFHYVSYKPTDKIEIGLFEGSMWHTTDTVAKTSGIPALYYAPIPLLHTATNGLNGEHNVLLGLNAKIDLPMRLQAYGQVLIDNPDFGNSADSKYGFQLGVKAWDLLGIPNLYAQAEFNHASAHAYAHSNPRVNWTHSNQAIAHPLGSNFSELVAIGRYNWGNLHLEARATYAQTKAQANSVSVYQGSTIYLPDYEAFALSAASEQNADPATLLHLNAKIAFVINPRTNLQLYAMFNTRKWTTSQTEHTTQYLGLGIRTSLYNTYFDF